MRKALDRLGVVEGFGVRRREEKMEKNSWLNGVGRFRLLFTSPFRLKKMRMAESILVALWSMNTVEGEKKPICARGSGLVREN